MTHTAAEYKTLSDALTQYEAHVPVILEYRDLLTGLAYQAWVCRCECQKQLENAWREAWRDGQRTNLKYGYYIHHLRQATQTLRAANTELRRCGFA